MSGRREIWYIHFLLLLVCSCKLLCPCLNFYRNHVQKSTKNCNFAVFYSIKTVFLMSKRHEIWYVHILPPIVYPCKISCQCLDSCRSHAQKRYKKSLSCSILQHKNKLPDDGETWNLACRFLIPFCLTMYNFMSLYWFLWQPRSKRYNKLQFCSILQYKNRLPDVRETWDLECMFLIPASLPL